MQTKLLILAGLGDSGEKHWQSFWQHHFPNTSKVIQNNWEQPDLNDWITTLEKSVSKLDEPTVLVAHSLACSLVAHWSEKHQNPNIIGAFLVAPADVDSAQHTPESIRNFSPIPLQKLPFPSLVVASENDPYASIERKHFFAKNWGSEFRNVGPKGHINSDSNLALWEEGQELLLDFIKKINP